MINLKELERLINAYDSKELPTMLESFCIVSAVSIDNDISETVSDNKEQVNLYLKAKSIKLEV